MFRRLSTEPFHIFRSNHQELKYLASAIQAYTTRRVNALLRWRIAELYYTEAGQKASRCMHGPASQTW